MYVMAEMLHPPLDARSDAGQTLRAGGSKIAARLLGGMSEWLKETGCKPVGYAYAGSNPAPPISPRGHARLDRACFRPGHGPGHPRARRGGETTNVSTVTCSIARGDPHELAARRPAQRHVHRPRVGRGDRAPGGLCRSRRREVALRRGRRRAADCPAARLPGVLVRLAAA